MESSQLHCDLTVSELFQAYYDCRKTKRNTWNALRFEENLERNLMRLYRELVSGEYLPGRSICFVITHPRCREVWAADFRDRIVHHAFYNRYSDYFYRRFIHDSYACIPNKGALKAADRATHFMRSVSQNFTKPAWVLKADFANFFNSIDKNKLDAMLAKHVTDPWWLDLTRTILHNDPRKNVFVKSSKKLLSKVPEHKSLLRAKEHLGLPIGNLSSQFFANIYLDELDQFAKHKLKLKHYIRYVDDVLIFGEDGSKLHQDYLELDRYARKHLGVNFSPVKTHLNRVEHGFDFVGYIIKPYTRYLRRSVLHTMRRRITDILRPEDMRATVNSYFGMMKHTKSFVQRKKAAKFLNRQGYGFDRDLTKLVLTGEQKCTSV
jgi:RNA-directed DNA polymerase